MAIQASPKLATELAGAMTTGTADRILEVAKRLIQTAGYANFSYADISRKLNITTASIHYHFPTKSDLGRAVISRYRDEMRLRLQRIREERTQLSERFDAYVELYVELVDDDYLLCPGAMLAAETRSLPIEIQDEVKGFFRDHEDWLLEVITESIRPAETAGSNSSGPASEAPNFEAPDSAAPNLEALRHLAQHIVSSLEGALMISRLFNDEQRFQETVSRTIAELRQALSSQALANG